MTRGISINSFQKKGCYLWNVFSKYIYFDPLQNFIPYLLQNK